MARLPQLLAENDFFPDLTSIPEDVRRRAKILALNYPNSPTGRVATREFYQQVVEFAQTNELIVVQDAAHIMLSFERRIISVGFCKSQSIVYGLLPASSQLLQVKGKVVRFNMLLISASDLPSHAPTFVFSLEKASSSEASGASSAAVVA